MTCWPFPNPFSCGSSAHASVTPWRPPQWPSSPRQTQPWTYSRMRGFDNDSGEVDRGKHVPRHHDLFPTRGIMRERQNTRQPVVRNPGVTATNEQWAKMQTRRPRTFQDPHPAAAHILTSAMPQPQWSQINPMVGNSWVSHPVAATGDRVIATPARVIGAPLPMAFPGAMGQAMPGPTIPAGTQVMGVPAAGGGLWILGPQHPAQVSHSSSHVARPATPAPSDSSNTVTVVSNARDGTWVHINDRSNKQSREPPPARPSAHIAAPAIPMMSTAHPVFGSMASMAPLAAVPGATLPAGTTVMGIPSASGGIWALNAPATNPLGLLPGYSWVPHPHPVPSGNPAAFWAPHPFSVPRQWAPTSAGGMNTTLLTGGVPLPGTAPGWTTPTWPPMPPLDSSRLGIDIHINPCLAPNPNDATRPHVSWDVSQHPNNAKRTTGRSVIMSFKDKFNEDAVYPATNEICIQIDHRLATAGCWGPIIARSTKSVTVFDVLMAIYEYGYKQLTAEECEYFHKLGNGNYTKIVDSFDQRCRTTPDQPEMWEREQGLRRFDTLGDQKRWWGMWVTHTPDGRWFLNLGLRDIKRVPSSF